MFEAYFLDQGRVDAILLGCDGEWIFVDSGFRSDGLQCVEKMKKLGVSKLRYYIGTHGHKNHVGGAGAIISAMKPDAVYIPHNRVKEAIIKHAAKGVEKQAATNCKYNILRPNDRINFGESTITCLGPLKIKQCSPGAYAENANSLILRVLYKGRSMLLTGDTSATIMGNVHSKNEGCLKSEVYKNAHHNGKQPESILKKIKPIITIICNGSPASSAYKKLLSKIGSVCYSACKKDSANTKVWTDGTKWNVQDHCFKKQ